MDSRDVITREFDVPNKEGAILRRIVNAQLINRPITVNDILHLQDIGSPATNHAFLKKLIKRKLVKSIANAKDNRIKNLYPTEIALDLFEQLSKEFYKCAKRK